MHLIIDNDTMQILGAEATADDVHDSEVFDQLISTIKFFPKCVTLYQLCHRLHLIK